MNFLARFLANHVLANLTFLVVLVMGVQTYLLLPREQDPSINFNWIDITTVMPGGSAEDIEKQVTDVLEDAIDNVDDVRFVSSNSRESVSSVLVRFEDIDSALFDKRVNDLRREIQNQEDELPDAAESPRIFEVTSANALPVATVVVTAQADDENLRRQADAVKQDIERLNGVDAVLPLALRDPELLVEFLPERLDRLGVAATDLADTVSRYYRDVAAGTVRVNRESWLVRVEGADSDPQYLAGLPVITAQGELPLGAVAEVSRGRKKADQLVRFQGRAAVLLAITKKADANLLQLVDRLKVFIDERNALSDGTGVDLTLVDDQTQITRSALQLMRNNALVGLGMVLVVTWLFLGTRIAVLTCIGIPFVLAGTLWVLGLGGQTLNVTVLLGIVISLGMLVDDAVVVVEAIFYRLQRGADALTATLGALREVFAPVTTAVLTTMAAFLPLMLLPGILGKFMRVIPLVVTTALAISLIEAYWMLPAHVMAAKVGFKRASRIHRWRVRFLRRLRLAYTRLLVRVLRWPKTSLAAVLAMILAAFGAVGAGAVKFDFFASDTLRLFYVNVEMPTGTPIEQTLEQLLGVERKVHANLEPGEARAVVAYAGQMFTEIAPRFGDRYGQILVGLNPRRDELRSVEQMIEDMRREIESTPGPSKVSFLRLAGGPPTSKPISIKVRGDEVDQLRAAVVVLKDIMAGNPAIIDIADDDSEGLRELRLRVDGEAVQRAGLDPLQVSRAVNLLVDGEVVASLQHRGETVDVRVRAKPRPLDSLDDLLRSSLPLSGIGNDGRQIPLAEVVEQATLRGEGNIRHYNFRRTITVEADIDSARTDTVQANDYVLQHWAQQRSRFPNVNLDFSGELDDINESLDAIAMLFLFGVGLIYVILGTQFNSYFQPLMILASVPMAFAGVVLGLVITGNPMSLFTVYGVVALAGIAVNSAIVLISAANSRRAAGMSVLHATIYAARRRVVPILITSLTTIAGLFSLAAGLAGRSLIWGPVATAIVWGLAFSTVLTLLMVPLLYRLSMGWSGRRSQSTVRP